VAKPRFSKREEKMLPAKSASPGSRPAVGEKLLAQTKNYLLHRNRNLALKEPVSQHADCNRNDCFRVMAKQRRDGADRAAAASESENTCDQCGGWGTCECVQCGGMGRINYLEEPLLPTGVYPTWCTQCGGSGLTYCMACQGSGIGFSIGFRID